MKQFALSDKLTRFGSYAVAGILVLLPFHAPLTTWLGSNFGAIDGFRIWKELLIVLLVPFALYIVSKRPELKTWLRRDMVVQLILLYTLMHCIRGIAALNSGNVTAEALVFGLLINLRFLGMFLLTLVFSNRYAWLKTHWQQVLLWPAMAVIVFGLLQQFVLPSDWLRHLGYSAQTIAASQSVDNKSGYLRVQSTMRGANSLGAYLLLIITVLVALVLTKSKSFVRYRYGWLGLAMVLLLLTFSRSAWLGTLLSLGLLGGVLVRRGRKQLVLGCVILFIISTAVVWLLRDNNFIQNSFFHTDETSTSQRSSNNARVSALSQGIKEMVHEPLGRGPGTAGPASVRNNQPRIAENYFVQIGQEVGIFGLLVFLAITVLVAVRLWRLRTDLLPLLLVCSLAGITLINMFLHAWTDDSLSLLWWALAGIALSSPAAGILKSKHEQKAN